MYNFKKIANSICLKAESSTKWNKIPITCKHPNHVNIS